MGASFMAEVYFDGSKVSEELFSEMKGFQESEVLLPSGEWKVSHDGSSGYMRFLNDVLPSLARAAGPIEGHFLGEEGHEVIMPDGSVKEAKQVIVELLPDGRERVIENWLARWVPKED